MLCRLTNPVRVVALAAAALGTAWFAHAQRPAAATAQPAADARAADRAAVLAAVDGLTAAFSKGDAKALAAHWTADGEHVGDDGTAVRGRAAIEKAYAEFLGKNADHRVTFEPGEVRFPSRDTAVVEGHMALRRGTAGELTVSRSTLLMAREDGKWLVVILRESPAEGASVRELDFLMGTWAAKAGATEVRTTYEWTANKTFVRCRFSVSHDGKAATGMQMIGRDPATDQLRVWTFEDEGGVGEADMRRDGKRWVQDARAVLPNGHVLTATHVLTPVDADTFTWQSVERTLNDEALPDLPPLRITRVKGTP